MSYLDQLYDAVEQRVADKPSDSFGLILDGWTRGGCHLIAIFAAFDDSSAPSSTKSNEPNDDLKSLSRRSRLLSFCPVKNEEDLSAQSLFDVIVETLSRYKKPWEAVKFMVGRQLLCKPVHWGSSRAVPHIGCAFHRFKLAVQRHLDEDEALFFEMQTLMVKLRTITGRALLRQLTQLSPVLRTFRRWSSLDEMLQRYAKLEPFLNSLEHGELVRSGLQPFSLQCPSTKGRPSCLLSWTTPRTSLKRSKIRI